MFLNVLGASKLTFHFDKNGRGEISLKHGENTEVQGSGRKLDNLVLRNF